MGLTISDVSSLISRNLFYNDIKPETTGFLMMQRGDPRGNPIYQGIPQSQCGTDFCECYFDVGCDELFDYGDYFDSSDSCGESVGLTPPPECDAKKEELVEQLYQSTFAMYADHGGPNQWVNFIYSNELNELPPLMGYSFACITCGYGRVSDKSDLFCANMIRKGAIGYIGGNDNIYGHHFLDEFLEEAFDNDKTIGEAFKVGKNKERIGDWEIPNTQAPERFANDFMVGDPTFNGGNLK